MSTRTSFLDGAHDLKCWPESFQPIIAGQKKHEIRVNDRHFKTGDLLHLREWCPESKEYTGDDHWCVVKWITHGGQFGLPENLCVMTIADTDILDIAIELASLGRPLGSLKERHKEFQQHCRAGRA